MGMNDEKPFAFAGIWERWTNPQGNTIETCAILTTASNELVGTIHDRMPVILAPEDYDRWLHPNTSLEALEELLIPYPAERMKEHEVSNRLNDVRRDAPEYIEPVK